MSATPRLLDLFCGAGGCAVGYARAGFEVAGVDIERQVRYPYSFHHADAIDTLRHLRQGGSFVAHVRGRETSPGEPNHYTLDDFDAIHASPPCQDHMQTPHKKHGTGWLLDATRKLLEVSDKPWVIENVPGAPMRPDFKICGCQVGLELRRERWFETSWHGFQFAEPHNHPRPVVSVVGHGTPTWVREKLGFNPTIADYRAAMGIDWMNRDELSQAIPPAYCEANRPPASTAHRTPPPCGRGRVPFKESRAIRCVAVLIAAITTVGIHTATARSGTHDTSKLSPQRLRTLVYRSHPCLARIIDREDPSWDPTVSFGGGHNVNDSYGLGQANPGTKMARFGSDWRTNPWTQLRWMGAYAVGRYGSECAALAFWLANGWW